VSQRPVFPLPALPGWNENGFGFFPGLRTPQSPMTHAKAGTAPLTLNRVTPSSIEPPNGITTHHMRLSRRTVALPVTGHGAVGDFGWAFTDIDHVGDPVLALPGLAAGSAQRPTGAQAPREFSA
jgi:hypothetical protein